MRKMLRGHNLIIFNLLIYNDKLSAFGTIEFEFF